MLRGGSSAAAFWDELRTARSSGKKGIKEECVLKQIEAESSERRTEDQLQRNTVKQGVSPHLGPSSRTAAFVPCFRVSPCCPSPWQLRAQ